MHVFRCWQGVKHAVPGLVNDADDFHGLQMLSYGCTRLEIGLQSIYEDVARDTNRGHTVAAVGECFRMAKDAGFKVRSSGSDGVMQSHDVPDTAQVAAAKVALMWSSSGWPASGLLMLNASTRWGCDALG